MTHEILFAGFGGQGILSMGMTLAYAGIIEGKKLHGCLHTVLRCAAVLQTVS